MKRLLYLLLAAGLATWIGCQAADNATVDTAQETTQPDQDDFVPTETEEATATTLVSLKVPNMT